MKKVAQRLEQERDDFKLKLELAMGGWNLCQLERDALRKALDELATEYKQNMIMVFGHAPDCDCRRCDVFRNYNRLTHRTTSARRPG